MIKIEKEKSVSASPEEKSDVKITALKFGECFKFIKMAVDAHAPSEEEIKDFQDYLSQSETLGPMTNPNAFIGGTMFDAISQNRERIDLLKSIQEHFKKCEEIIAKRKRIPGSDLDGT